VKEKDQKNLNVYEGFKKRRQKADKNQRKVRSLGHKQHIKMGKPIGYEEIYR
jgi:hypothetical protein